jgi:hypothetical protein
VQVLEASAGSVESAPGALRLASGVASGGPLTSAPSAIQKAIEEVNHIVETLRGALDDMEEVFETLELAERQKNADEAEIENLRRSLRPLRGPRDEARQAH